MAERAYPFVAFLCLLLVVGCTPSSGSGEHAAESLAEVVENQPPSEAEPPLVDNDPPVTGIFSAADQGLPPELQELDEAWVGDFDGMQERRVIRVLTSFGKGLFSSMVLTSAA